MQPKIGSGAELQLMAQPEEKTWSHPGVGPPPAGRSMCVNSSLGQRHWHLICRYRGWLKICTRFKLVC